MHIPWERGAHTALPILVLASKEMEAAVQISGVLLHAAWHLLRCKTLAVAIPHRLPKTQQFQLLGSGIGPTHLPLGRQLLFRGSLSGSLWAASRRMCPTVPNRPRLLSIIIYPVYPGYTQLVGRLVHGDPWAIKVGTFCVVRRSSYR